MEVCCVGDSDHFTLLQGSGVASLNALSLTARSGKGSALLCVEKVWLSACHCLTLNSSTSALPGSRLEDGLCSQGLRARLRIT